MPSKTQTERVQAFEQALRYHLKYSLGRPRDKIDPGSVYWAAARSCRDQIVDRMQAAQDAFTKADAKRLYYLSMEFLVGRSLANNLLNLGLYEVCEQAVSNNGHDLADLLENEHDPALGNGGLGRLAACFIDSLATLDMPGYGYGIRYDFGLFKQEFRGGYQWEKPDQWHSEDSPWLFERPDAACVVPVYGRIEHGVDREGGYNPMWMDWQVLIGVPYDLPIVGYGGKTVNVLRLFAAHSSDEFDMEIFNEGDYVRAVEQKIQSETVSKVLYPSDEKLVGKELRLVQEYFLVACSVRDIMRQYLSNHKGFGQFAEKVAIQLNDTHPALTVAELMRMLVDEHGLEWDEAWTITQGTCGYTNHTLLAEALEKWPVSLFEKVLPRHLQIIYEINRRFLEQVAARWPDDPDRLARMSIIEEGAQKQVRMAHLAIIGSHSVNGVAAVHSELVKSSLVPDFYEFWPERFNNKTNGITQRRWLLQANPGLAGLITEAIGDAWITDLDRLRDLEEHVDDAAFQERFLAIKQDNKERLARLIYDTTRIRTDTGSLFDIQAKRIHEYKRQLLNAMHIIHDYLNIVDGGVLPPTPRTCIFAGKAAPGYYIAKLIIKLINNMGTVINGDPRARDHLRIAFVPDYKVSVAEKLIPAAELSEQTSTAGYEASGTGNMKFALNGALTMGTMDGANIEIHEEVGGENIYIFGLSVDEVRDLKVQGYNPWDYYHTRPAVKRVMDAIGSDLFSPREGALFRPLFDHIMHGGDQYLLLADLESYIEAQDRAARDYQDRADWARRSLLNVARMGKFSSDRTIRQYAQEIWGIESLR
jgi:starch phosphorylase